MELQFIMKTVNSKTFYKLVFLNLIVKLNLKMAVILLQLFLCQPKVKAFI